MAKTEFDIREGTFEGEPCTCKVDVCPLDCKGQCGCKACHLSYQDYLSSPGE